MRRSPSALELSWPTEHQHVIFRELGWHYSRHGRAQLAAESLSKAAQANPLAVDCHYRLAVAQLRDLRLDAGLESCRRGLEEVKEDRHGDFSCALLEQQILFERGDFEEHLKGAVNRRALYTGHRRDDIEKEVEVALKNYESMIGGHAGGCFNEWRKKVQIVTRESRIRNQDGCDAVSIVEEKIRDPHIRRKKKIEKDTRMLGQLYLGRTWKDQEFLQSLRSDGTWDKVIRLPETKETSNHLSDIIEEGYRKVSTSLYQLQSRTPVYTHRNKQFQSKLQTNVYNATNVSRWRYKTYREAYDQLDQMNKIRKLRDLPKLLKYAEETLWKYYQTKTTKIFPEQYKFITEVCNLVGLAMLDQLDVPPTLMDEPLQDRLRVLFKLPNLHEKSTVAPVFGDKSTYTDPGAPDYRYLRYKNRCRALENHLRHSRYPIERALLYHALARAHTAEEQLDAARIMAGRVLQAAAETGSNLWYFLGTLKLVETDCVQRNVEKLARSLDRAEVAVVRLGDERLEHVVRMARIINDEMLREKMVERESSSEVKKN